VRDTQLSATVFTNRTSDLIEQVTLDATTRQRRNIAQASATGLELEASWAPVEPLLLRAGYALTASRVVRYPEDPSLEGNALPELPRHSGSLGLQWRSPRWVDVDARLRVEGSSFADDQNALALPAYALIDLSLARKLREEVTLYASVSNLLDTQVLTDRTETLDFVGAPRTVWAGFRVSY
jgi:iron complex outermembrane receptor protein